MKRIAIIMMMVFCAEEVQSQDSLRLKENMAVIARSSPDSITLRWAPLSVETWRVGNEQGYTIERIVMVRDGKIISAPERQVLAKIVMWHEDQWQKVVAGNRYAAIAAQALFGESFDIEISKSDVVTIVNKVKENEQRFYFALLSADMSPVVAVASGLWFTDHSVKQNEKYLYNISTGSSVDRVRGSIFTGPLDRHLLSKPQNLKADFRDGNVQFRWEKPPLPTYTSYYIERSTNGKDFTRLSPVSTTTVSPSMEVDTRFEYGYDSISNSTLYYYRVVGVTPFGELSEPSEVVKGVGKAISSAVPHVLNAETDDNRSIRLSWEYPDSLSSSLRGFYVERAEKDNGPFTNLNLTAPLPAQARSFDDKNAMRVNYYRVAAIDHQGTFHKSPTFFATLIDSIPPTAPENLQATVSEFGQVKLSWHENTEKDIYGYRVYFSNNEKQEFTQLTEAPIASANFETKVDLSTLNEFIYYRVLAVDQNQNHSLLSKVLTVSLPDKVRPMSPVMLPLESDSLVITIRWTCSSSHDVVKYELFRQQKGESHWIRIKSISANGDSAFAYSDREAKHRLGYRYTVIAVDDAGLESLPTPAIDAVRIDNRLMPAVEWIQPVIDRERNKVVLKWKVSTDNIDEFWLFKGWDEKSIQRYRSIKPIERAFEDQLNPSSKVFYKIMYVTKDQRKSALSDVVVMTY